jgi:hypothetical protein
MTRLPGGTLPSKSRNSASAEYVARIPIICIHPFIPTLDEINVDLASVRIPSISMQQSKDLEFKVERALLTLLGSAKAGPTMWRSVTLPKYDRRMFPVGDTLG